MRVDAARHGLDLQQRTRLKTAFKRAAKASNTLTVNQQYQFFEHLNWTSARRTPARSSRGAARPR